jgi:hypothetical protein
LTDFAYDFYFAYGMNLDPLNVPGFKPVCAARLLNYRLMFRDGLAVVEPFAGAHVEGALWLPNEVGWKMLDGREGHPNNYYREKVLVATAGGFESATVYLPNPRGIGAHNYGPPSGWMRETIAAGYDYWLLDKASLEAAVEQSTTDKEGT